MLEFEYTLVYRAIGAFILSALFTLLFLGVGFSKIKEILVSSGELEDHQAYWLVPLMLVALLITAIIANPVVAVVTAGGISVITALISIVRLKKSY